MGFLSSTNHQEQIMPKLETPRVYLRKDEVINYRIYAQEEPWAPAIRVGKPFKSRRKATWALKRLKNAVYGEIRAMLKSGREKLVYAVVPGATA
jgi:hypothetical protein